MDIVHRAVTPKGPAHSVFFFFFERSVIPKAGGGDRDQRFPHQHPQVLDITPELDKTKGR